MRKIGVITTNKVLAQSLSMATGAQSDCVFEFYPLLNLAQALLDVEILNIEVALLDVTSGEEAQKSAVLHFCEALHAAAPQCRLLLLLSQDDKTGRKMAIEAVKSRQADDFVFYDASLDYLFAKLCAI